MGNVSVNSNASCVSNYYTRKVKVFYQVTQLLQPDGIQNVQKIKNPFIPPKLHSICFQTFMESFCIQDMATTGALKIFLPCAAHRKPGWIQRALEKALFSGALISLQIIGNSSLVLNEGIVKSSVLLSEKKQQELLI